ncbi:MAG TPA: hypothetical protein VKG92_06130, partial [Flavobacteriales bacterium]|nr:hypothetical protein [Flavobacteriales bacterium]
AIARELGLGAGSGTTNTVDPAGIALAAIKGMSEVVSEQQAIIDDKQTQIDALNERLERLEQLLVNEGKAQGLGLNGENATTSGSALRISPNPFSERTSITYQVNCACRVRLEVSTADGKPLKTLLDEQRAVGSYTFEWNTSDITPGMYFCTLLVDGKPSVKQAVKVN